MKLTKNKIKEIRGYFESGHEIIFKNLPSEVSRTQMWRYHVETKEIILSCNPILATGATHGVIADVLQINDEGIFIRHNIFGTLKNDVIRWDNIVRVKQSVIDNIKKESAASKKKCFPARMIDRSVIASSPQTQILNTNPQSLRRKDRKEFTNA